MSRLTNLYLPVAKEAQRLGLVAPCKVKLWDPWYAETRFGNAGRLCEIVISQKLLNPLTRIWVLSKYREYVGNTTAADIFAHELGHVFRYTWIRNRTVAPLKGYHELFGYRARFKEPWNDMIEYLERRPGTELDISRYISWYAWSDPEEDFCDCFAELIKIKGDCSAYRNRPGVYKKLKFIQQAGRRIFASNPVLRNSCRRNEDYLAVGETMFKCPEPDRHLYCVPDKPGNYMCPCGTPVVHDGRWIKHV